MPPKPGRTLDCRTPALRARARRFALGLALASGLALAPSLLAAQPAEFRAFLRPETSATEPGQAVDIRFEVDASGQHFNAYAVTIAFDPAIVDFEPPVVEGSLMTGVCGQTIAFPEVTDSTVTYTHAILCAGQTVNGPGILSTYRFRALANGSSPIRIVSDPSCTFADAGVCVNPAHPTLPRQVVFTNAEIQVGPPVAVASGELSPSPEVFLLPIAPNPFRPATALRFELDRSLPVVLAIHDAAGRQVWERAWPDLAPGRHETWWSGRDGAGAPVPSGIYFLRLVAGDAVQTRKLSLVR
jgi:hypothetical protein